MKFKLPKTLKKGDKVAIVCTARSFTSAEAIPAIQLLESWGLTAVLGDTIDKNEHQLGGTDKERADDLQQMLNHPEIKAIWIARGGYGTVRIIDLLDFTTFQQNPKWIIGFSDITVLHSKIHNMGISSLHGIMPFSVPKATQEAKESLKKILFGEKIDYKIPSAVENQEGVAEGVLVGGNLSILYSLLGSETSVDTTNKILYIEDLDEYLYHIDRMMQNLKRNGYFKNIKGVIVGGMTDMHDNQIPFGYDAKQIILKAINNPDIPICFDFPAGHIANNLTLCLGQSVRMLCQPTETTVTYI